MWSDKESNSDFLNYGEVSQLAVDIKSTPRYLDASVSFAKEQMEHGMVCRMHELDRE